MPTYEDLERKLQAIRDQLRKYKNLQDAITYDPKTGKHGIDREYVFKRILEATREQQRREMERDLARTRERVKTGELVQPKPYRAPHVKEVPPLPTQQHLGVSAETSEALASEIWETKGKKTFTDPLTQEMNVTIHKIPPHLRETFRKNYADSVRFFREKNVTFIKDPSTGKNIPIASYARPDMHYSYGGFFSVKRPALTREQLSKAIKEAFKSGVPIEKIRERVQLWKRYERTGMYGEAPIGTPTHPMPTGNLPVYYYMSRKNLEYDHVLDALEKKPSGVLLWRTRQGEPRVGQIMDRGRANIDEILSLPTGKGEKVYFQVWNDEIKHNAFIDKNDWPKFRNQTFERAMTDDEKIEYAQKHGIKQKRYRYPKVTQRRYKVAGRSETGIGLYDHYHTVRSPTQTGWLSGPVEGETVGQMAKDFVEATPEQWVTPSKMKIKVEGRLASPPDVWNRGDTEWRRVTIKKPGAAYSTAMRLGAEARVLGNFEEFYSQLPRGDMEFLETVRDAYNKKFNTSLYTKSVTKRMARVFLKLEKSPGAVGGFSTQRLMDFFRTRLGEGHGKWKLPAILLAAAGGAAMIGLPSEAEAAPKLTEIGKTLGTGAAATAVERFRSGEEEYVPGLKRAERSSFDSEEAYLANRKLEDEIAKAREKGKFGRDFVGSIVASWVGDKWAKDVVGFDFQPSIAGHMVGDIPLWLLGGKVAKSVIKGGKLGHKVLRAAMTGQMSRVIPEGMQVIHGDKTVGEAMLSTTEEGIVWGLLDLLFAGLGGASRYLRGVGAWNGRRATVAEAELLERNLLDRMVNYWPEKIGGPLWDGLVATARRIPGFERIFVPAITELDIQARRAAEDVMAERNMLYDDARKITSKIFLKLSRDERRFATNATRAVKVIDKNGDFIPYGKIAKKVNEVAKPYGITPARARYIVREHIRPVKEAFWGLGKEKVALNMMKHETLVNNLDYLNKKYWTKEMYNLVNRRKLFPFTVATRKEKLHLNALKRRRDLPQDYVEFLDPIDDFGYLSLRGMMESIHDNTLMKFLHRMSAMESQVAIPGLKKSGIGYDEVKRLVVGAGDFEHLPALGASRVAEKVVFARNKQWLIDNGWKKLPKTLVKGFPKAMKVYEWGPIAGMYVPPETYKYLNELTPVALGKVEKTFIKLMSKWKYGKVILRPATHVRNLISNLILNDLGGLPFYRMDKYWKAGRAMLRGVDDKYYRMANTTPLLRLGTYGRHELQADPRVVQDLAQAMGRKKQVLEGWFKFRQRMRMGLGRVSRMYDAEEKIFKMAKFIDNVDKGMAAREAAEDAMKWTFNYGQITPAIQKVRTYAMPFVTFSYKAFPIIAETALKHPVRLMKWPLMAAGLTYAAVEKFGMKPDEWNYVKRVLPQYMRAGHFALIPYRDEKNRLQIMDLTYILPWGDIGELQQQGYLRLAQNPAFTLAAQLYLNKNFFGAPIYQEWEDPEIKTLKVFNHIWRQLMPAWSPDLAVGTSPELQGGFDFQNLMRYVREEKDAPTLGQVVSSSLGFKLRPIDPAREGAKRRKHAAYKISEAKSYYRSIMKKDPTAREKALAARAKSIANIRRAAKGERTKLSKIIGVGTGRPFDVEELMRYGADLLRQ